MRIPINNRLRTLITHSPSKFRHVSTCRAVLLPSFGGPQNLEIHPNVEVPPLKPNEVLVHSRAVSINPLDTRVSFFHFCLMGHPNFSYFQSNVSFLHSGSFPIFHFYYQIFLHMLIFLFRYESFIFCLMGHSKFFIFLWKFHFCIMGYANFSFFAIKVSFLNNGLCQY